MGGTIKETSFDYSVGDQNFTKGYRSKGKEPFESGNTGKERVFYTSEYYPKPQHPDGNEYT